MPGRGPTHAAAGSRSSPLTADEFATRLAEGRRVLWTIAAAVLGDPSEAEDVLQEASVMALERLEQYRRGTNFQAWMGSFVRNVARNGRRKRQRRGLRPLAPDGLGLGGGLGGGRNGSGASARHGDPAARWEDGPRPDQVLAGAGSGARLPVDGRGQLHADAEAFDDRVLAALRGLGATPRACLLLRSVLDLSYREIGQALEIPEGTAMSHVHRARMALRAELAEEPDARAGPGANDATTNGSLERAR